ncbi:hypothetical protein ACSV5M_17485 [Cellvibrio sp. ARAG 10.3]|uniref:hypothetical protein n=1 Tax=Cellvibrio sp. ARAG 10.3 TaxID=3451358 RepID=UPI003F4519D3
MEIIRPDYQYSPLVVYSLGGVELVFRLPQHYGNYPPVVAASDINIHDHDLYQGCLPLLRYLPLIENSWMYRFKDSPIDACSVTLYIAVVRCDDELQKKYDFLNQESFSRWVIDAIQQHYGTLIEEELLELKMNDLPVIEEEMWQFPKETADLEFFQKCGVNWCCGWTGHPSMGSLDPFIRLPLANEYALEIVFSFGGFNPNYFESIELVEKIKEELVQEFLEHVHINYSPETLAEIS